MKVVWCLHYYKSTKNIIENSKKLSKSIITMCKDLTSNSLYFYRNKKKPNNFKSINLSEFYLFFLHM